LLLNKCKCIQCYYSFFWINTITKIHVIFLFLYIPCHIINSSTSLSLFFLFFLQPSSTTLSLTLSTGKQTWEIVFPTIHQLLEAVQNIFHVMFVLLHSDHKMHLTTIWRLILGNFNVSNVLELLKQKQIVKLIWKLLSVVRHRFVFFLIYFNGSLCVIFKYYVMLVCLFYIIYVI
jgi:hypothetical protein